MTVQFLQRAPNLARGCSTPIFLVEHPLVMALPRHPNTLRPYLFLFGWARDLFDFLGALLHRALGRFGRPRPACLGTECRAHLRARGTQRRVSASVRAAPPLLTSAELLPSDLRALGSGFPLLGLPLYHRGLVGGSLPLCIRSRGRGALLQVLGGRWSATPIHQ